MFKKMIFLSLSFLWIPSIFAAQTTLNFQNPKQSIEPGTPIPPSDFANQVKATNAQKHTQFKQQLDQQKSALSHPQILSLSQVQSMSQTPPPPAPTAESDSTSRPLTTNTNKLKPSKPAAPSSDTLLTPENTQEPIPPPPPPNGGSTLPAKPTQTQPYTGFPQSQPSNNAAPKNTGGFNIQY